MAVVSCRLCAKEIQETASTCPHCGSPQTPENSIKEQSVDTFAGAVSVCFKKYFTFSGRASRSEYWYFYAFFTILCIIADFIDNFINAFYGIHGLLLLTQLALLFPMLSVASRRLHDVGRSGWWQLLPFTIIGVIPYLYWMMKKGMETENQYGEPTSSP